MGFQDGDIRILLPLDSIVVSIESNQSGVRCDRLVNMIPDRAQKSAPHDSPLRLTGAEAFGRFSLALGGGGVI
jgi:hypothetical protein